MPFKYFKKSETCLFSPEHLAAPRLHHNNDCTLQQMELQACKYNLARAVNLLDFATAVYAMVI